MSKRFKLTLLVLLVTLSNSFGQNDFRAGYIIANDDKIIPGLIEIRSNAKNYESCIFKSGDSEIAYYPNQIKGFGYTNDRFFSSQVIEGSFVEVLVKGEISLYKSRDKYHVKKDTSFLDIDPVRAVNDKVGDGETSKWRSTLTYLISDCLNNSSGLSEDTELSEESLTDLVVKYNKCDGSGYTEFKAKQSGVQFGFGLILGISSSEISTNGVSYLDDSYTSIDPTIGLLVEISARRLIKEVTFQSELHFIKSNYSSLVERESPREYHDSNIELTTLSIPLSFKYSFPEKEYGFYLQGGINYDYHINSDSRLLSEQINGNVVNTFPEAAAFDINNSQLGYLVGIGILKSYPKFKGSVAIRYFKMPSLNKTSGFTVNNSRLSLNLILTTK